MIWTQGTIQACVIAAGVTVAVVSLLVGFSLRARLERGIRREYRELFSVCRRSMQGATEYGGGAPAPVHVTAGAATAAPSVVQALARRDRPIPVPAALLKKRGERLKTTEWMPASGRRFPDELAARNGVLPPASPVRLLGVVSPLRLTKRPSPLPTATHCMKELACEELVLTGGLTDEQRNA